MKLSLNITDELNSKLEEVRKKQGLTKNALVINLISRSLDAIALEEQVKSAIVGKFSDPDFLNDLVKKEVAVLDNKK